MMKVPHKTLSTADLARLFDGMAFRELVLHAYT